MGSNSKDVQIAQKELAEQELATRLATLAERGVTEAKIEKDSVVRHLKSNLVSLKKRLNTIDELAKRKAKQDKHKADKAATPKVKKKGKNKLAAEAQQQQQGGKKKNKKKKK